MSPPSSSDEFTSPKRSASARVAEFIERVCLIGIQLSIPMTIVVMSGFFLYLIGGFVLLQLGFWSPSYPFLSITEDVYFAWLGFLTGGTICLGTGCLIGLALLTDGEGEIHNDVSILASFIGFGFGAGVMRMTYEVVLASVLSL